jgi:hypothetical protein
MAAMEWGLGNCAKKTDKKANASRMARATRDLGGENQTAAIPEARPLMRLIA